MNPANPTISKINMGFCVFYPRNFKNEIAEYNLALIELNKEPEEKDSEPFLRIKMHFDLMKGIVSPAFVFQVCYEIVYAAQDKDSFKVIKDHIAIAHAIPYLRELVASMTMRAGYQPLILPPLNTQDLHTKYIELRKDKDDSETKE